MGASEGVEGVGAQLTSKRCTLVAMIAFREFDDEEIDTMSIDNEETVQQLRGSVSCMTEVTVAQTSKTGAAAVGAGCTPTWIDSRRASA